MKRHLHLAMGVSSVLLAACCLAGAGLAWLRAAVSAVARTALVCAAAEPAQMPADITAMTVAGTGETALPPTVYWFGATRQLDRTGAQKVDRPLAISQAAFRSPMPPGTARAGPGPGPVTGTIT